MCCIKRKIVHVDHKDLRNMIPMEIIATGNNVVPIINAMFSTAQIHDLIMLQVWCKDTKISERNGSTFLEK